MELFLADSDMVAKRYIGFRQNPEELTALARGLFSYFLQLPEEQNNLMLIYLVELGTIPQPRPEFDSVQVLF